MLYIVYMDKSPGPKIKDSAETRAKTSKTKDERSPQSSSDNVSKPKINKKMRLPKQKYFQSLLFMNLCKFHHELIFCSIPFLGCLNLGWIITSLASFDFPLYGIGKVLYEEN